ALATHERLVRPFAEQTQALAHTGKFVLNPTTGWQLFARNQAIRLVPVLTKLGFAVGGGEKTYTALALPEYGTLPAHRSSETPSDPLKVRPEARRQISQHGYTRARDHPSRWLIR